MAPLTMMPKSIAPSESRFAGTLVKRMSTKANNSESGTVRATIRAERTLPRNSRSTSTTSPIPTNKVWETVARVACTSSVRSK